MKRTAANIFDAANTNGAVPLAETELNSNKVHHVLQTGSESNYARMMDLCDEQAFPPCK
jgi:hypothetical protein